MKCKSLEQFFNKSKKIINLEVGKNLLRDKYIHLKSGRVYYLCWIPKNKSVEKEINCIIDQIKERDRNYNPEINY